MSLPPEINVRQLVEQSLSPVEGGAGFMISGDLAPVVDEALAALAPEVTGKELTGHAKSIWLDGHQQCELIVGGFKKLYDAALTNGEPEAAQKYFCVAIAVGDRMLALLGHPTLDAAQTQTHMRRAEERRHASRT